MEYTAMEYKSKIVKTKSICGTFVSQEERERAIKHYQEKGYHVTSKDHYKSLDGYNRYRLKMCKYKDVEVSEIE